MYFCKKMSWTPTRSAHGLYEFKHKNGMKLLLYPRDGLKVTTANITYHVGSRNEGLGVRGGTHYLEHGMFKGSKKFNKKLKNGMWKLEELGAYMNATTYNDRTNYFSCIASDKLEEVISREADRMIEPLLDPHELKNEMTVVRNEFERGENNDFEVLQKRVMAVAFMAHPYHTSTIGWRSEIETVSAEALRKFHDTFYRTDNSTYTFVGNFDIDKVMNMVDEYFPKEAPEGSIPEMLTTEPTQMGQRRVMMRRPTNCALMCMAFKATNGLHRDSIVLKVMEKIISHGPRALSSPFKRDETPVHDIIAEWSRMKDPYLFSIWGTVNRSTEAALQTCEEAIIKITKMFQSDLGNRLEKAKHVILNEWSNEMSGSRGIASTINEAIARGDPFDVFNRIEVLDSVTPDDLKRVASKVFDLRQSTVGWLLPGDVPKGIETSVYPALETQCFDLNELPSFSGKTVEFSDHEWTKYASDKTDVRISLRCNECSNPVKLKVKRYATLNLLSQLMTRGFHMEGKVVGENQLFEYLSEKNIQRNIHTSSDTLHVQASIPNDPKLVSSAMGLVQREINNPILRNEDFNYLKTKWRSELNGSDGDVNNVAKITFAQTLFGKEDPNYKYSIRDIIRAIDSVSYSDVTAMHKELIKDPTRLVTIVSPSVSTVLSDSKDFARTYKNVFLETSNKDVNIAGKSSVVVKYGMVIPEYSDALSLAIACLGNGFSGMLMQIVRDKYGLTYGINSRLKHANGCAIFEITGTFAPSLLSEGIKRTEEVIKEWLANDLTPEQIDVQRNESLGSRNVQFDAPGALASAIHMSKITYGKEEGVKRLNNYESIMNAITYESVNQAKQTIQFENLSLIKVGTL